MDKERRGTRQPGAVIPCSLDGINPAYHPEVFGNATSAREFGFEGRRCAQLPSLDERRIHRLERSIGPFGQLEARTYSGMVRRSAGACSMTGLGLS
jgi:hypothetical protein